MEHSSWCWGFHPRSLESLSDQGLECLALLFAKCEEFGCWGQELITLLVRLPKPDGEARLIGLIDTLVRVWGRARRPLSAAWEHEHRTPEIWGSGAGRSSSDAAFDHAISDEIARYMGEHSVTVMIDLWKCYELVAPECLMQQAAELGFPLRLAWMCVQLYAQPRAIQAFGSVSQLCTTSQGIIAGCSHATTLLMVLTTKAVQRVKDVASSVRPRALVDDITLHWTSSSLSKCVELRRATAQSVH